MGQSDKTVFLDDAVEPQLRAIVKEAEKYVTLVTPYISLWRHLQTAINDAVKRGVRVVFITRRKNDVGDIFNEALDVSWLLSHKVEIYRIDGLHAKIYLNEKRVLISSMNVTKSSPLNSYEFAMIVENARDAEQFRRYVSDLIEEADLMTPKGLGAPAPRTQTDQTRSMGMGGCIRCGRQISFNPSKPLCPECYKAWAVYQNEKYEEPYCHACGAKRTVTFAKPVCRACYNRFS